MPFLALLPFSGSKAYLDLYKFFFLITLGHPYCYIGLMVIFSCAGLSNLVAASYEEDKYGVVQKCLPDILLTLLSLHEVESYILLAVCL